jgi:hypothetical protein
VGTKTRKGWVEWSKSRDLNNKQDGVEEGGRLRDAERTVYRLPAVCRLAVEPYPTAPPSESSSTSSVLMDLEFAQNELAIGGVSEREEKRNEPVSLLEVFVEAISLGNKVLLC